VSACHESFEVIWSDERNLRAGGEELEDEGSMVASHRSRGVGRCRAKGSCGGSRGDAEPKEVEEGVESVEAMRSQRKLRRDSRDSRRCGAKGS
jgi:hypothetical protein